MTPYVSGRNPLKSGQAFKAEAPVESTSDFGYVAIPSNRVKRSKSEWWI